MCYLGLHFTQHWWRPAVNMRRTIAVGYRGRWSCHVWKPSWKVMRWRMAVVAIFHWVTISSAALVALAPLLLLVLPDPVPLVVAPRVVRWRTSVLVKEAMVTSPTLVLTGSENGEVALKRFQQFVHNIATSLSSFIVPKGIVVTVPTVVMSVTVVVDPIGRMRS